jgi:VWFA-related protein
MRKDHRPCRRILGALLAPCLLGPLAVYAAAPGGESLHPETALRLLTVAAAAPGLAAAEVEWEAAGTGIHVYSLDLAVEGPEVFFYRLEALGGGFGADREPALTIWNEGDGAQEQVPGVDPLRPLEQPLKPLQDRFGESVHLAFPRLAWAHRAWPPPLPQSARSRWEPCDGSKCRVLTLDWPELGVRGEYLLEATTDEADETAGWRLRSAVVLSGLDEDGFARPASDPALAPALGERLLTVHFLPAADGPRVDGKVAARVRAWKPTAPAKARRAETAAQDTGIFYDQVDVRLGSVKVRPVDRHGAVVEGLTAEDFQVLTGGREATVEAVDWIPPEGVMAEFTPEQLQELQAAGVDTDDGRLVVLFVHTSFYSHRLIGLSAMIQNLDAILDSLSPRDQLAVVSYDTHLKLRLDFTRDRDAIRDALKEGMIRKPQGEIEPAKGVSLVPNFDWQGARDAAFVEVGLHRILEALQPLPGEKLILLLSWGLGAEHGGQLNYRYRDMVRLAMRDKVTISSVFLSNEQSNLTPSVQRVASQTGGTFINLFGDGLYRSLRRLSHSLGGHYRVTFELPEEAPDGRVLVDVTGERRKEVFQVLFPDGPGNQTRFSSQ